MIALSGVSRVYPGRGEALHRVDLEIDDGEFVFLTGHSGAGKSTLLRVMGLVEPPSDGQVVFDGRNLTRLGRRERALARRNIGFVFQDHRLLPGCSVFDNVALPLRIAGVAESEVARRVRAALSQVGLLERQTHAPARLSLGEQQRVGIARAVVARPRLLLADEPTGNLDPQLARDTLHLFERFSQIGVTVVVGTHAIELIASWPQRRVTLHHGRVVADVRPAAAT